MVRYNNKMVSILCFAQSMAANDYVGKMTVKNDKAWSLDAAGWKITGASAFDPRHATAIVVEIAQPRFFEQGQECKDREHGAVRRASAESH